MTLHISDLERFICPLRSAEETVTIPCYGPKCMWWYYHSEEEGNCCIVELTNHVGSLHGDLFELRMTVEDEIRKTE